MVDIKPFKAIRPNVDLAHEIASLPYDVVSRDEAKKLVENNPYSYLHIDRSEVDLPNIKDPYAEEVYEKATENLAAFQDKGWLEKEHSPYFYIYELTFQNQTQTGLVVTASVEDYVNDVIKKHEFTRYDKEKDRIRHMDVCDANTSPVFLTYREVAAIDDLIFQWKAEKQPLYAFGSFYETHHRVWRIEDEQAIHQLITMFREEVPALYIADGHHRTASAAKVAQKRKEEGKLTKTGEYFLSVLFPIEQLRIFDYNRLVKTDLPEEFINKLSKDFKVKKVEKKQRQPTNKHNIALYYKGQWYHLTPKTKIIPDKLVESLDASIVQKKIFEQHIGITDPRQDDRLEFVGGIKGLDALEVAVDREEASLAVALYPTEKEDLLAVADAKKTMPPKSTWFEPKLLSGLFVHDLESILDN